MMMVDMWKDNFDGIEVGAETASFSITVTEAMVADYMKTIEFDQSWWDDANADEAGKVVPVDLVPKLVMRRLFVEYGERVFGRHIRVKQSYKFLQPILVGSEVTVTGWVKGKYEKRDKKFVEFEAHYVGSDGSLLLVDNRTSMILFESFKMKGVEA